MGPAGDHGKSTKASTAAKARTPARSGLGDARRSDRQNGGVLPVSAPPPQPARLDPAVASLLTRDKAGLVAAIIQDDETGEVLMLGWMDDQALARTLSTGRVTFWSRSRQEYWRKGDTSGHVQYVKGVSLDCDGDALLVEVDQVGAACHTGKRSCFLEGGPLPVVEGHRPAEQ